MPEDLALLIDRAHDLGLSIYLDVVFNHFCALTDICPEFFHDDETEMIEKAGLQVGDRLPPAVAIAGALGVGRSTIREALNRWEGMGLIRRRQGDGTYLTARVHAAHGPLPTMVELEGEASSAPWKCAA